MIIWFFIFFN